MSKAFAWIKRVAAILLVICFALPLSRCTTKVEENGRVVSTATHLYGYAVAKSAWNEIKAGEPKGAYELLAVLNVFFVPIICLGFKEKLQSGIYCLSAFGAAYVLVWWVFVFASSAEIGGVIAISCWVLLFIVSVLTLFELWRSGRLFERMEQ